MKTLWEKNNLITSNTLFNNVSHPIKDTDLYSILCNHLKKKKDVTQNIKFVFRCADKFSEMANKNANYECFPFPPPPPPPPKFSKEIFLEVIRSCHSVVKGEKKIANYFVNKIKRVILSRINRESLVLG